MLAIATSAFAIAPPASANMAVPTWSLDDFWDYNVTAPSGFGTVGNESYVVVRTAETVQVAGIDYTAYRLDTTSNLAIPGVFYQNMTGFGWFRTSDLAFVKADLGGTLDFGGTTFFLSTTVEWNPPQDIHWPLMAGGTWAMTSWMNTSMTIFGFPTYGNLSVTTTFDVEPEQPVTVPAGTFTTTPLNATDSSGTFNTTYWSPTVGNYVLRRSFLLTGQVVQAWELTSYRYLAASDTTPPAITGVTATPANQIAGNDVNVSASITDDTSVSGAFVNVTLPDSSHVNRSMSSGPSNRWYNQRTWNQVGVHTFVIWATDLAGRWASATGSFTTVAPDTTPPSIVHTPPTGPFYPDASIRIETTVTDDVQVQEVRIDYTDVAGTRQNVTMPLVSGKYVYTIPAQNATGTIRYRIYAVDPQSNAAVTQEYTLTVEARPQGLDIALVGGISIAILVMVAIAIALLVSRRRKKAGPPTPPPPASPPPP